MAISIDSFVSRLTGWRGEARGATEESSVLELQITGDRCVVCMACTQACLVGAVGITGRPGPDGGQIVDALRWDADGCTRCEGCVEACPTGALKFCEVTRFISV